jgi:hypothetical protein
MDKMFFYTVQLPNGCQLFKGGVTNIKDDPRPGRPISATSEQDISTVKGKVDKDPIYTVEEIGDIWGLSVSYVLSIL